MVNIQNVFIISYNELFVYERMFTADLKYKMSIYSYEFLTETGLTHFCFDVR